MDQHFPENRSAQEGELYRLLAENVRDYAIFLIDRQGKVQTWTEGAKRLLGYSEEEILGQPVDIFFTPEDREKGEPQREIRDAEKLGRGEDDRWHIRKDGSRFWASGVMTPLRGEDGKLRGFAKIMRDQTPWKRADEARQESEARLQEAHNVLEIRVAQRTAELDRANKFLSALLESLHEGIAACDAEGRLTLLNRAAIEYGLPQETVPAPDWPEHYGLFRLDGKTPLAPEEVPLFRALHGEHVQNVEIVMARQDGPKRTLLTSGQAFFDEQGKKLGAVVSFQDITEQKRAVEELREAHQELEQRVAERTAELAQANESLRDADRRKDEFLAMLAHELRNPLTPIRTGLDLLAMEEDVGNRESVGLMQQQIEHVVRLVDDLLDVSRIIRGRIDLHRSPTLLSSIIHRSVETMRPLAESHQQELVVSVPDDPIYIDADSVRVVQVIENLLHNATKYTNVGGRIELVVEQQGSAATITIRDTGTGIDAELLPRVFELFSQSDRSLDRAEGGLGIGLTLVKQLVEMHGGTVSAQSDGAGCGSTFTIRLPIVEAVTQTDQKMERSLVAMNRRILVVDDNEGAAWMVSRLLQKLGNHQIETAHDGPAALEKIEETRPEIILLDIGLPEMDGYEVGAAVRKMPELADVLLIAMTGYGQEEDRRKSREVGFDEHLTKPPSIDQMRMVLSHPKLAIRAERR